MPPPTAFPRATACSITASGWRTNIPTLPHAADWTDDTPDGVLEPGMVLCVESYIGRLGGREGVKIEEQVLITETGNEQLSRYPLDARLMGELTTARGFSVCYAYAVFVVVEQNVGDDGCGDERTKDAEHRQQNLFGHDESSMPPAAVRYNASKCSRKLRQSRGRDRP